MEQIGAQKISLRGPGPWHGMSTLNDASPYDFSLLENVYVNSDGSEIRLLPGFHCVLDPTTTVRDPTNPIATGFERTTVEVKRPVRAALTGPYFVNTAPTETMVVWSKVTHVHGMEQLRGRWTFFGETSDRREPLLNAGKTVLMWITGYDDNGVNTDLTVSDGLGGGPNVTANDFNALRAAGGDEVVITGINPAAAAASLLNNKRHTVVSVVGNVVKVSTNIGAIAPVVGQTAFLDRVAPIGSGTPSSTISDDQESLTIWTSLAAGNPVLVSELIYASYVANRQRDFGDATGNIKEGNSNGTIGRSRRRQKSLPYRLVPHIAGNRLILAAPGYGCVFQAPMVVPINYDDNDNTFVDTFLGIGWFGNDIYDKPRALGVPKAVCYEDPDKAVASSYHVYSAGADSSSFGGSGGLGREGTYKFKFAYKDEATGDVGLCSEPISITTDTGTYVRQGLRFLILFAGYMMHETMAFSINVYRTAKNGNTFFFDRTIPMASFTDTATPGAESAKYGLTPQSANANYYYHVEYDAVYQTDALLQAQTGIVPDTIQQMPMGCKAARTIRGWTFFGGALGDSGSRAEMQSGNTSLVYDRNTLVLNGINYNFDELTSQGPGITITSVDGGYGCAGTGIPPAYSGQAVVARLMLPYPRQFLQLNKLVNTDVGFNEGTGFPFTAPRQARLTDIRYQVLETPLHPEADYSNTNRPTYLLLPRGHIQISQPDTPSQTPATNTTVVANEWDEDVEAIGDMHGQAVICTRNKTYMLGFAQTPVGVPAEIASDRFGCIAPNSMVEFDGGCAWLSDRGPVAMMGEGIEWIGQELEKFFIGESSRYKRDSQGMMRHSWGCHDAERGLLYFGVYSDRNSTAVNFGSYPPVSVVFPNATDQQKSRWPCDEILVYSYRVKAWSVWRLPVGMEVKWMTRGQDANGNSRVFALLSDNRVYILDDMYGYINRDGTKTTVLTATTGTSITLATTLGQAITDRNAGTYVQTGMPVLILSGSPPFSVKYVTAIASVSGTSPTINLTDTVTVAVGDRVFIGAKIGTIKSNFLNPKGTEATRVSKYGMRYNVWSLLANGTGAFQEAAAVKTQVNTSRPVDGSMTETGANVGILTGDGSTTTPYDFLVLSTANNSVYETGNARAAPQGQNHQVTTTLVSGASLRVTDIYVEVQ